MTAAQQRQGRVEPLRLRLLERGDTVPVVLPPWALDDAQGDCTTLTLLAPAPTHFVVRVHPWPGLPSAFASSAGAFQLTRCGRERVSFLQVLVEMRSPRAVLHSLVAVGAAAPPALTASLPERDAGAAAPLGEPGPAPPREPLAERLRRFEEAARNSGARAVESALLPSPGYVRLALEPGCHRFLASGSAGGPFTLLLSAAEGDAAAAKPERIPAGENGDVRHELCTARPRRLLLSVESDDPAAERRLAVARYDLPRGLPGRFGPEVAERLVQALGGSLAPRQLGTLVHATLGAQGRTPLPRTLLPRACYLAVAVAVHGVPQALSLGAEAGATHSEATSQSGEVGAQVGFCTGKSPRAELDVEARGVGVAWLFMLFQLGPAKPELP